MTPRTIDRLLFGPRMILIGAWMFVSCVIGFGFLIARWGDLNLDRYFGRLFGWGGSRILGWRIEVEGGEHLERASPCIFIVNHQSNLDIIPCGLIYPERCIIIGKKELLFIPFFGLYFAGAGNVLLDRKRKDRAHGGLDQAVATLKKRQASIWIFPEGTRNRTKEILQPFKKGAFHMAIRAQVPLVPIAVQSLRERAAVHRGWTRPGAIRIRVLPPIPTEGMGLQDLDALSAEAHRLLKTAILGLTARP